MLGKLLPCAGGPPIVLLKPRLLVGRQSFCDIPLAFPSISSRHCELEMVDGVWHVRDLGSSNGTRVNGVLRTDYPLWPDDVLSLSKYRYTVAYAAPAGRPPPSKAPSAGEAKVATPSRPDTFTGHRERPIPEKKAQPLTQPGSLGELVPCGGGEPIPLRKPKLLVGRAAVCDVVIPVGAVSSRHCELTFTDGYWFVRDLGSRNGVRVDGVRREQACLKPGCVLWIAQTRYRVAYIPRSAAPPPADVEESPFARSLLEKAGLIGWRRPEEEPAPDRHALDGPE